MDKDPKIPVILDMKASHGKGYLRRDIVDKRFLWMLRWVLKLKFDKEGSEGIPFYDRIVQFKDQLLMKLNAFGVNL